MSVGYGEWRRLRGATVGTLALVLLGGCSTDSLPPAVERDPTAPIQTDATYYALERSWDGLETEVTLTIKNEGAETIYLVNCGGAVEHVVEKWVDGAWETFLSPAVLTCLSPPIVIEPGSQLVEPLTIWGALPGRNSEPAFESDDVQGIFRIVIGSAVYNYDESRAGFGDPVPLKYRYSNSFALDDPRR